MISQARCFLFMCGPRFCSMKITQDVRECAAKQIGEDAALGVGMKEKAEEFVAAVNFIPAFKIDFGLSA